MAAFIQLEHVEKYIILRNKGLDIKVSLGKSR